MQPNVRQNLSNLKSKSFAKQQDARRPRFNKVDDSPKDEDDEGAENNESDTSQRASNADLLRRDQAKKGIFNKRREISASASRSP